MNRLTFTDNLFILHNRGSNNQNYQVARQTTSGSITYYAWLAADGSHIVMKRNATDTDNIISTYFFGESTEAFATNWTNRASLTYVEYNALFA